MKRAMSWVAKGAAAVATVVVFAGLGGFAASELMLRQTYAPPKAQLASLQGSVERGRHIATVEGCHDCHGKDLTGQLFHDEPAIVRAFAPNLTLAAAQQSDAQLEHAIRHGVAADGRSLWIMPSDSFNELTDQETADLIAYLRSFKPRGQAQPRLQVGPVGRLGLLLGKFQSSPKMIRTEAEHYRPDLGAQYAHGRELARACTECHGKDLSGRDVTGAPDLEVAAAYAPADFARLLRTGVASGDRKLGLMSRSAPARFAGLSDADINDLHAYLKARADKGL